MSKFGALAGIRTSETLPWLLRLLAIVAIATRLATLAFEPATKVPALPTIYLLLLSAVAAAALFVLELVFGLASLNVLSTRFEASPGSYLVPSLLDLNWNTGTVLRSMVVLRATVMEELIWVSLLTVMYKVAQLLFTFLHLLGNGSLNRFTRVTRLMTEQGNLLCTQQLLTIGVIILPVKVVMAPCSVLRLLASCKLTEVVSWRVKLSSRFRSALSLCGHFGEARIFAVAKLPRSCVEDSAY